MPDIVITRHCAKLTDLFSHSNAKQFNLRWSDFLQQFNYQPYVLDTGAARNFLGSGDPLLFIF